MKQQAKALGTINRENWRDVNEFLYVAEHVNQNDPETLKKYWGNLRHLLEWADSRRFTKAHTFIPSFPVYLLTARNDGKEKQLSPASLRKICENARSFFAFQKDRHPDRYKAILPAWIRTIVPSRARSMSAEIREHAFYTLDDVLKIARTPVETLTQERDRAGACLLFLSGMRIDAFVSMPIHCLDLVKGQVHQNPSKGIRTKNHKAAITSLLTIPDLFDVVKAWDVKVRAVYSGNAAWYALLKTSGDEFAPASPPPIGRDTVFRNGLATLCEMAGVKYLSPHKFRHGHVVYAMSNVYDMRGIKAVSQNVMHKSIEITDGIYGGLLSDDVHDVISNIGANQPSKKTESKPADLHSVLVEKLLEKIANDPALLSKLLQ